MQATHGFQRKVAPYGSRGSDCPSVDLGEASAGVEKASRSGFEMLLVEQALRCCRLTVQNAVRLVLSFPPVAGGAGGNGAKERLEK